MSIIAAVLGVLAGIIFVIVSWLAARGSADKGLMARMPPAAFPAALVFADDDVPRNVRTALKHTIEYINHRVGRRVYADLGDITEGMTISVAMERGPFYARASFRETSEYARLRINPNAVIDEPSKLPRALAHELLHFAGLAHDQLRDSVMYPRVVDGDFEITDRDRELVRNRLWNN